MENGLPSGFGGSVSSGGSGLGGSGLVEGSGDAPSGGTVGPGGTPGGGSSFGGLGGSGSGSGLGVGVGCVSGEGSGSGSGSDLVEGSGDAPSGGGTLGGGSSHTGGSGSGHSGKSSGGSGGLGVGSGLGVGVGEGSPGGGDGWLSGIPSSSLDRRLEAEDLLELDGRGCGVGALSSLAPDAGRDGGFGVAGTSGCRGAEPGRGVGHAGWGVPGLGEAVPLTTGSGFGEVRCRPPELTDRRLLPEDDRDPAGTGTGAADGWFLSPPCPFTKPSVSVPPLTIA